MRLPPYTHTPAHVTPADDMAQRLDGLPFNSVTSHALWLVVVARLGSARDARLWLEFTAKQGDMK